MQSPMAKPMDDPRERIFAELLKHIEASDSKNMSDSMAPKAPEIGDPKAGAMPGDEDGEESPGMGGDSDQPTAEELEELIAALQSKVGAE